VADWPVAAAGWLVAASGAVCGGVAALALFSFPVLAGARGTFQSIVISEHRHFRVIAH
jgi:hypothetical protein